MLARYHASVSTLAHARHLALAQASLADKAASDLDSRISAYSWPTSTHHHEINNCFTIALDTGIDNLLSGLDNAQERLGHAMDVVSDLQSL